jgi:hypothetical protein
VVQALSTNANATAIERMAEQKEQCQCGARPRLEVSSASFFLLKRCLRHERKLA